MKIILTGATGFVGEGVQYVEARCSTNSQRPSFLTSVDLIWSRQV